MQLEDSDSEHEQVGTSTAISDSEGETSETDSTPFGEMEKTLKNIELVSKHEPSHSLRQRQLGLLASEVKRTVDSCNSLQESARLRVLEETKERWISLGMINEEDAHLLESVHGRTIPISRSQGKITSRERRKKMNECSSKKRGNTSRTSG